MWIKGEDSCWLNLFLGIFSWRNLGNVVLPGRALHEFTYQQMYFKQNYVGGCKSNGVLVLKELIEDLKGEIIHYAMRGNISNLACQDRSNYFESSSVVQPLARSKKKTTATAQIREAF